MTFARPIIHATRKAYLQTAGRCPINRRGYPVSGVPVAVTRRNPFRGTALGTWIPGSDMSLEPGQQLGQNIRFDVPALTTSFKPSIPSVVTTPAPAQSSVWNPITSLMNLWDARPQVLKNIRLSVDPNTAMRALQGVVKPGQIAGTVDQLRAWGINPSYQGIPVTGSMAGYGYQLGGFDFQKYLPWIIGGGAVLLILPMVMGRKK